MSSRTWAGTTLEDRAAWRRAALIDAGTELLGTEGAAGVTVRAVCRATKLSERYFYESFDGRDALLRAVHAQVADQARDAIVAVVAAHAAAGGEAADESHAATTAGLVDPRDRHAAAHAATTAGLVDPRDRHAAALAYAAVGAFTAFLEEDPRRGRVLLSESFSDTVLARHDIELVPAFAALLVAQITALPDGPDAIDAELTAVALIGALRNLYLAWMEGRQGLSAERLNAHAARLIIAAARVSSRTD